MQHLLALGTRFVRGDKSNTKATNPSVDVRHFPVSYQVELSLRSVPQAIRSPKVRRVDGKTNNIVIYSLSFAVIGLHRSAVRQCLSSNTRELAFDTLAFTSCLALSCKCAVSNWNMSKDASGRNTNLEEASYALGLLFRTRQIPKSRDHSHWNIPVRNQE